MTWHTDTAAASPRGPHPRQVMGTEAGEMDRWPLHSQQESVIDLNHFLTDPISKYSLAGGVRAPTYEQGWRDINTLTVVPGDGSRV